MQDRTERKEERKRCVEWARKVGQGTIPHSNLVLQDTISGKKDDGLYCHFLNDSFYLIDKFHGKITCNARHSYSSVDDIVYVLSNWKNTSDHENPMFVGGLLHVESVLFKSLQKYLGHISLCEQSVWENSISTFK